jgi:UPF0176 protein
MYKTLTNIGVFGRIYIASEGINAQISVPENNFDAFKNYINSIEFLQAIRLNIAVDDDGKSFWALRIKVREKIVADGITDNSFSMQQKGQYVDAQQMNQIVQAPNTMVIDMRNHYEFEVGHFKNAIQLPSDTFKEQLPMAIDVLKGNEDKNIIMYCTGGIRCEKASAYLLHNGFKNVYHLEGGIINYTQQVKHLGLENKFIGKNFVFDNRLGERITDDIIAHCHQCNAPCDEHTNCFNAACHLLFIQCKTCKETYNNCCSESCKQVVALSIEEQKTLRSGKDVGRNIFNKSKQRLETYKQQISQSNK